jgi:hypothetical protein
LSLADREAQSIRRGFALALLARSFDPPHHVIRKARKRALDRSTRGARRLAFGRQCLAEA